MPVPNLTNLALLLGLSYAAAFMGLRASLPAVGSLVLLALAALAMILASG